MECCPDSGGPLLYGHFYNLDGSCAGANSLTSMVRPEQCAALVLPGIDFTMAWASLV